MPPGSEAMHCRSCAAQCPQAVRQGLAKVPLPAAPRQRGSTLQEVHCPLLLCSEAVRCMTPNAHSYEAVS